MEVVSLFTPTEAAAKMRISPRTLERARRLGDGCPYIKLGRRVFYRSEDIAAFVEGANTEAAAQQAAG